MTTWTQELATTMNSSIIPGKSKIDKNHFWNRKQLTSTVLEMEPQQHDRAQMVINVEQWNLFPLLAKHEENCLDQLECSENQEPPHLIISRIFKARQKLIDTLPRVSEAESEIVKLEDKPKAGCDLKNVVSFDGEWQIEWAAIAH